jgi:hypothetical protein
VSPEEHGQRTLGSFLGDHYNDETGGWSERTLALSNLLLIPWALFQGASPAVIQRVKEEGDDDEDIAESAGNALEMAILGNAKRFIRSPSAQKVIGRCFVCTIALEGWASS